MYQLMPYLMPIAVVLATLAGVLIVAGILHFTSKREAGWLHLAVIPMLAVQPIGIATSARSLSSIDLMNPSAGSAIFQLLITPTSILLALLATERLVTAAINASKGQKPGTPSSILIAYFIFWLGNFIAPAAFGEHNAFTQSGIYNIFIGAAFALANLHTAQQAIRYARTTILLIAVVSFVLIFTAPSLVIDSDYTQGLFPGMPRLAGLAPHAVAFGFLIQLGMICLYAMPLKNPLLNIAAWGVFGCALLMAQAKGVWISTLLCVIYIAFTKYWSMLKAKLMDPTRPHAVIAMLSATLLAFVLLGMSLTVLDVQGNLARFMATGEGVQLASLTGRDQIWATAIAEWQRYPIFGYGLPAFDVVHRMAIGISSATHAHNQIFDTLARSGLVGLFSLLIYISVLIYWSLRYKAISNGVTMLFLIALLCKGVSEVPFVASGYGIDSVAQWLLIALIAGSHKQAAVKTSLRPSQPSLVAIRPAA